MPLDGKIITAIFAAAREHGVDKEGVYDAIRIGFKKDSVRDLTRPEALSLIVGLRGGKNSPNFAPGRRKAMAGNGRKRSTAQTEFLINDAERQMLLDAAAALGWDASRLEAFCQRQIKKGAPCTMSEMNKVLWALKAIARRKA